MKKITKSPLFLIIFGFIVLYSLLDIFTPERKYSEIENKYLAVMPTASLKSIINGEFEAKYENYICEQFIGRDLWINTKSFCETCLLKTENNSIVYGKDGYMFPKFYRFDVEQLKKNMSYISHFADSCSTDVSVMVVPSSFYPLANKVPKGLPSVDENYYINKINQYFTSYPTTAAINVKDILAVNSDSYIFYKTDHHWTSYGAYLAYTQFASDNDFKPFDYSEATPNTVNDFYGTSYSKSKALFVKSDDIEYFEFDVKLTADGVEYDSLYNYEMFDRRDKYAAFIYGNNAYTEIETESDPTKLDSVLVIGDSYCDSFIPFLCENYKKIVMVDPRYYNGDYSLLSSNNFSDILVLYSFENLVSETSVAKLLPDE